jgi:hypothetical protein
MEVTDAINVEGFVTKLCIPEEKKTYRLILLWRAGGEKEILVGIDPFKE